MDFFSVSVLIRISITAWVQLRKFIDTRLKVYCLEYSCLQRSRHWFPQLRKFWAITGGICLSILSIFLLFLYCSKWLQQICGYHWDFYINHYFACPNNQHILINSSRWHLIDFVTRFQTKTTIVVALFLGLFQILGQVIIFRTNLEISREITELLLHKCGTPDVVFSLNNDQRQKIPLI